MELFQGLSIKDKTQSYLLNSTKNPVLMGYVLKTSTY